MILKHDALLVSSVVRSRKRAVAVGSSLKSNKKVSSLVDKVFHFLLSKIYGPVWFLTFSFKNTFIRNTKFDFDGKKSFV